MRLISLSPTISLYHADCREALRELPDNSVDAVPCDPPYELNFMGKGWDDTGIANDPALWREVFRVLKPGGHLAAFSASRTYHRMACAIEDAGFEIRDSLCWLYGQGFPKSLDVSKAIDKAAGAVREVVGINEDWLRRKPNGSASENSVGFSKETDYNIYAPATDAAREWEGWGTALKPAFEPIVLARKPLSEPTVAANVLRWRTGALNIDGCRVPGEVPTSFPKRRTPKDDYVYEAGFHKSAEETAVASPLGRWPANVVHDGSDEVVGMFPSPHGAGSARKGKFGGEYDATSYDMSGEREMGRFGDSGSAARFFKACPPDADAPCRFHYSAKASRADRNGSKHPTVKPIALMQWLARLITPPGGTILDPFAGSGTTGAAARAEGFRCLLVEREAEYVADIRARLGSARPMLSLDQFRREALLARAIRSLQVA